MSLVYAYVADAKSGKRPPQRLSAETSAPEGWEPAGVAFYGSEPGRPGSAAVYEFSRVCVEPDGARRHQYAYSTRDELGGDWVRGPVAFFEAEPGAVRSMDMQTIEVPISGRGEAVVVPANSALLKGTASKPLDGSFRVESIDYANWMYQHPLLHGKKLRNLCLPTTHDSGTSALQHVITDDSVSEGLANVGNVAKRIGEMIAATGIGHVIDVPKWVTDNLFTVISGLARTTRSDVTTQLRTGVRGFDFRVFYHQPADDFFVAHGLLGIRYSDVLNELADFLAAAPGEIVHASFTHFDHMDDATIKARFTAMLEAKLGPFAYSRNADASNNPLEQTYDAIVTQGGTPPKSRIIIQYEGSDSSRFWSAAQLGVVSVWTNTTDVATQWADQKKNFELAVADNKPFELSLSLTPSSADAQNRLFAGIAPAVAGLGAIAAAIPLYGWVVAPAIEAVAASLAIYGKTLNWWTVEDLADRMAKDMIQTIRDRFATDAHVPNALSRISVDFYEKTQMVNLAIELSGRPTAA